MELVRHCPTCRQKIMMHSEVDLKATHPPAITIRSQSSAHDAPVLEALVPVADDGCELVGIRNADDSVTFTRRSVTAVGPAPKIPGNVSKAKTRADLETLAAEKGVSFDASLSDVQLRTLLAKELTVA